MCALVNGVLYIIKVIGVALRANVLTAVECRCVEWVGYSMYVVCDSFFGLFESVSCVR